MISSGVGRAAVIALLASLVSASVAHAAFPGQDGKIAAATAIGRGAIATFSPDGGSRARLASGGALSEPSYSSDGRRIAFHRYVKGNYDIYTMHADGSHERRVAHTKEDEYGPSFSPDGRTIVYSRFVEDAYNFEIYSMRADGSRQRNLTSDPTSRDTNPVFAPNGRLIVFDKQLAIAIMRADGSHQRQLTSDSRRHFDDQPDFAPDGKRIIFTRADGNRFATSLYSMRTDGTHKRRLTAAGAFDSSAVFSPSGRRIAFARQLKGANRSPQVYTARADGSDVKRITRGSKGFEEPNWRPRRRR